MVFHSSPTAFFFNVSNFCVGHYYIFCCHVYPSLRFILFFFRIMVISLDLIQRVPKNSYQKVIMTEQASLDNESAFQDVSFTFWSLNDFNWIKGGNVMVDHILIVWLKIHIGPVQKQHKFYHNGIFLIWQSHRLFFFLMSLHESNHIIVKPKQISNK